MIEGVLLAGILVVAIVFAIRPWYRALIGKDNGCANCPGNCKHGSICVPPKAKVSETIPDSK